MDLERYSNNRIRPHGHNLRKNEDGISKKVLSLRLEVCTQPQALKYYNNQTLKNTIIMKKHTAAHMNYLKANNKQCRNEF
jgi:hypothetical protein